MKEINLTKGMFVLVDDDDYEYLNSFNWCVSSHGYAKAGINKKTVYMHRMIMGYPKGYQIDHINENKLDNRKENLRICTSSQNRRNISVRKDNTSGYKGVTKYLYGDGWVAKINNGYKTINLGIFATLEDAAIAYNRKAIELFGEFSKLNIIEMKE